MKWSGTTGFNQSETAVLSVRPKIAELVYHLYGRALHPELFEVYGSRLVERGGYSAKVEITSAGHVVTWRYQGLTLTEVAAAANHPLPKKRRIISCSLRGEHADQMKCRGGVNYRFHFALEPVEPHLFWTFQQELALEESRDGLLHRFDSSGRMALGAISFIHVESRNRSMQVRALHTFPDDCAIVRCQSVFELP